MKTAIYVRSAIKDDVAIKSQMKFCKDLLNNNEEFVVYADNGYSARDKNRPAFQNMIKDIEDGNVSKVIAYSVAHLCRDLKSLCSFWGFVEEHNATFTLVLEEVTTENYALRGVERFISAINEMEKKNHSDRCRQGWARRKQRMEEC